MPALGAKPTLLSVVTGGLVHLPCPITHPGRTARVPTCWLCAPNRASTHLPGKGLIMRKREQSLQTLNPTALRGSKHSLTV